MTRDATAADRTPGACPTPDQLSGYVEGTLDVEARSELQRHLLRCARCRDVVAEAARLLPDTDARRLVPTRLAWPAAAAAAAVLAVSVWLLSGGREPRSDAPAAALREALASEPTRPTEALLAAFDYAPPPVRTRTDDVRQPAPSVRAAAAQLVTAASGSDDPRERAAAGVAFLVLGDIDKAVEALEYAARREPNVARYSSDLSAAYLARARLMARTDDWPRALRAADQAIAVAPTMPEPHFNRALALEGLHQDARAADAWAMFRANAPPAAHSEAIQRERAARERAPR